MLKLVWDWNKTNMQLERISFILFFTLKNLLPFVTIRLLVCKFLFFLLVLVACRPFSNLN
ncbi:AAEL008541-PA [Aedes aegypti]|uniref:AAEL008541-PA n=1 Tax=Aedes aegypti TaxID=7159 RepID=Q16YJ4_AEDAE|nr:AAEL008541-PA [Aedes aegypti]